LPRCVCSSSRSRVAPGPGWTLYSTCKLTDGHWQHFVTNRPRVTRQGPFLSHCRKLYVETPVAEIGGDPLIIGSAYRAAA
jgi:hypothetical protein